MEKTKREKVSVKVTTHCMITNALLSAFKLFAGIVANSQAMISDAAESFSDIFSSLIVIVGVKMASKEADKEHPYGHERYESVAAIVLAIVVFGVGIGIGYTGILKIISAQENTLQKPGVLALVAAIVTIAIKEGMYWYVRLAAKKIDSSILLAEAKHHRSDAFSTIGTLAGIIGARLGILVLDPIAGIITCFFILRIAVSIFRDAIEKMTDRACEDSCIEGIHTLILEQENVITVDQIKTRLFGDKIYIDVEIGISEQLSLTQAHDIAHNVHDEIEKHFPKVKHCMVHVNPVEEREKQDEVIENCEQDEIVENCEQGEIVENCEQGEIVENCEQGEQDE